MKMKTALSAFAFLSTLGFLETADATELKGVIQNNQGVRKFESKLPEEAYGRFTDALVDLPFSPEVHYNIGNTFLANKEFEKALSEYEQALKLAEGDATREKEMRFKSLFNAGVALTELKRVDEALERYQQALELMPDSLETKTNIELLVQQQQGGGEGEGENQDSKGNQDQNQKGQGDDKKDQEQEQQQQQQQQSKSKPMPKPFKSEELSQQDVKRILEELKRQEEQIRAKFQNEGGKDAPPDKDW